jgi:t-SNARE complex subunit (syntaxin)
MALKPAEITRLEQLSDEMAKLIEDIDTTSREATVVYGKIGSACTRALANVAAAAARQSERDKHVLKFQSARETRKQKKSGTQAPTPPNTARPRASASTTA